MANDEHLHKAFSYFDKDGNGYIEPDELREALMGDGENDCTDVADDIFHEVDTDKVDVRCFFLCLNASNITPCSDISCSITGWTDQL